METTFENLERTPSEVAREKLSQDLKSLIHDTETLLHATAGDVSDKAKEARSRLMATLDNAKATCHRLQEKTIAAARTTDKMIHDHPYQAMGITFGLGLLVGVLITRK